MVNESLRPTVPPADEPPRWRSLLLPAYLALECGVTWGLAAPSPVTSVLVAVAVLLGMALLAAVLPLAGRVPGGLRLTYWRALLALALLVSDGLTLASAPANQAGAWRLLDAGVALIALGWSANEFHRVLRGPRAARWRSPGDSVRAGWLGGARLWLVAALTGLVAWLVVLPMPATEVYPAVSYSFFREQVAAGKVVEVTTLGAPGQAGAVAAQGRFSEPLLDAAGAAGQAASQSFSTVIPPVVDQAGLGRDLEQHGVRLTARLAPPAAPPSLDGLVGLAVMVGLGGLLVWQMRRANGLGSGFGRRAPAQPYDASRAARPVRLTDVAGVDEAKAELTEVVDFLTGPDRYLALGARIPRGVLLVGPPGAGKTLLARAVAGEAGVPFFSMSGSEFVEMFVGVGAGRVRALFEQARRHAPCIVFIDEIDAIGRRRGAHEGRGNEEREQTLNQILVEMDGFSAGSTVIVLAATNRADVLDPALVRPGRFDRQVMVQPPDRVGREAILRVHARGVPFADDVDLAHVASGTPGLTGAELANLVNEAALLAARARRRTVAAADFSRAIEKVALGAERRLALSAADRERVAYHEAGHALLGVLQPEGDPVRLVTIVPRGRGLGVTLSIPDDDRYNVGEGYLRARIVSILGGRAAEEIIYGSVTTGAENDIQQATRLARGMVGRWGMSREVGMVALADQAEGNFLDDAGARAYSERTARAADAAVRRIIDECYAEALGLVTRERDRLVALTEALLERESLGEAEILAVIRSGSRPDLAPERDVALAAD